MIPKYKDIAVESYLKNKQLQTSISDIGIAEVRIDK